MTAVRIARAMISNQLAEAAQYRVAMVFWSLSGMLQIVVYLAVWTAVADAQGGSAGGYTASQFAGYFIVLLVVRELTYTWTPWVFADELQSGHIASRLMIPLHPVWQYVSGTVVFKMQGMIVVIPGVIALSLAFHPSFDITWQSLAVAIPLVALAAAVRFAADYCIAQIAFWTTRLDGIRSAYYIIMLFMGGQFAPISLLPAPLEKLAHFLPFWWCLGLPVDVIIGQAGISDAFVGMGVLSCWLAVFVVINRIVWKRGIRVNGAVGL